MSNNSKIYIAGSSGMVGSAIIRALSKKGYTNLLTPSSTQLDLRSQAEVINFFKTEQPETVILAAARVGGILDNMTYPSEFLYDNLMIQNNVMHSAWKYGCKQFVFLASSCVYPKECPQPMKEEYLLSGPLEPTNEGYALAKIAGIKYLQYLKKQYDFKSICLMPSNLYGPNDHFDLKKSHVLSALVKRFSDAVSEDKKEVVLWGTGAAKREFMYVDDLAEATLFLMENYNGSELINVGTGTDISIKNLAELIAQKVDYRGNILWDTTKPNGMMRKCLDVQKLSELGYEPSISLEKGIENMIAIYQAINAKQSIA